MEVGENLNLLTLSENKVVLLVFLRHLGCIFCREALRDLTALRDNLTSDQTIVLVHMEENQIADPILAENQLSGCYHVADPEQKHYHSFGLTRGRLSQLVGLKTMMRGFQVGLSIHQFGGKAFGDAFQMPGIFVLHKGKICDRYVHNTISDRPNYAKMLASCAPNSGQ